MVYIADPYSQYYEVFAGKDLEMTAMSSDEVASLWRDTLDENQYFDALWKPYTRFYKRWEGLFSRNYAIGRIQTGIWNTNSYMFVSSHGPTG